MTVRIYPLLHNSHFNNLVKTFEKKAAPPKLYTLRFSVECEYEQMMALKRFLNENNIRYSRI